MKVFVVDKVLNHRLIEVNIHEITRNSIIGDVHDSEMLELDNITDTKYYLVDFGDFKNTASCSKITYNRKTNQIVIEFDMNDLSHNRKFPYVAVKDTLSLVLTSNYKAIDINIISIGFSGFKFTTKNNIKEGSKAVLNIQTMVRSVPLECMIKARLLSKINDEIVYEAIFTDLKLRQRDSDALYDYIIKRGRV